MRCFFLRPGRSKTWDGKKSSYTYVYDEFADFRRCSGHHDGGATSRTELDGSFVSDVFLLYTKQEEKKKKGQKGKRDVREYSHDAASSSSQIRKLRDRRSILFLRQSFRVRWVLSRDNLSVDRVSQNMTNSLSDYYNSIDMNISRSQEV